MENILRKLESLAAELRANHYSREEMDVFAHKIEAHVADIRNNSGASDSVIQSDPAPVSKMDPVSPIRHVGAPEAPLTGQGPSNPPLSTGAEIKEPVKPLFDSE